LVCIVRERALAYLEFEPLAVAISVPAQAGTAAVAGTSTGAGEGRHSSNDNCPD
jgi:hypothetical protein